MEADCLCANHQIIVDFDLETPVVVFNRVASYEGVYLARNSPAGICKNAVMVILVNQCPLFSVRFALIWHATHGDESMASHRDRLVDADAMTLMPLDAGLQIPFGV